VVCNGVGLVYSVVWGWCAALEEANKISLYLHPLRTRVEDMEACDYNLLHLLLAPFLHCVCLVWAHSYALRAAHMHRRPPAGNLQPAH
jgi:hypothetical protein